MENISRRSFLTWGAAMVWLSACTSPERFSRDNTPVVLEPMAEYGVSWQVNDIMYPNNIEAMQDTISSNTFEDISLAKNILCGYANCDDSEFVLALQAFQVNNWLTADGTIWPATLKAIYMQAMRDNYMMTPTQARRMHIYYDLNNYTSDRGRIPTSIPDAFNNRKFFWGGNILDFTNIPNSYITQSLLNQVEQFWTPNTLYIERLYGKMIMKLYDAQGVLYIASYVTGGTSVNRSPENASFRTQWTDKYHISSSYPEEGDRGAPMFAATNVDGWPIWVHSSADTIDGYDHSHGCFRTGLIYAEALMRYVNTNGPINIVVWNLYG